MVLQLARAYRLTIPFTRKFARLYSPPPCPACGSQLPTFLPTCPSCQYIAPIPSSMSYFNYFDLRTAENTNPFILDTQDLRRRFLQAQRLCHPDTWAQKGERELELAAAQSSQLNRAYQTLLSPLERAQYILSLHGVEASETEKLQDDDFIMQIMEARQEIEEALDPKEISRIKEINQSKIDSTVKELESHIGEQNWEAARKITVRLKYLLGIENAAKEWAHGQASPAG